MVYRRQRGLGRRDNANTLEQFRQLAEKPGLKLSAVIGGGCFWNKYSTIVSEIDKDAGQQVDGPAMA